ncbi:hypothetical protein L1887_37338 [Cichorium endivia]|nr:hypothetical protein L1887_37338 [Cichorium endivia]
MAAFLPVLRQHLQIPMASTIDRQGTILLDVVLVFNMVSSSSQKQQSVEGIELLSGSKMNIMLHGPLGISTMDAHVPNRNHCRAPLSYSTNFKLNPTTSQ